MAKNLTDAYKLVDYLSSRNAFTANLSLHNLVTGVTADKTVSADQASEAGSVVLQKMSGKNVEQHSFKKEGSGNSPH